MEKAKTPGLVRVPPSSPEAEMSVLGALLLGDKTAIGKVVVLGLTREDFYRDAHGRIYESMVNIAKAHSPIDIVTVKDELTRAGILDEIGGLSYLITLGEFVPTTANITHYAEIVREKAALRSLIENAGELAGRAFAGTETSRSLITEFSRRLQKIGEGGGAGASVVGIDIAITEAIENLVTKPGSGFPFGVKELDRLLQGLRPSEMTVLAARPGQGKTMAMCQQAVSAARTGARVTIASLEMPRADIAHRMTCQIAKIDMQAVRERGGKLTQSEAEGYKKAAEELLKLNITIFDTKGAYLDIDTIIAMVEKEHQEGRCDLFFLDYLQKVPVKNSGLTGSNRERQVAYIATELSLLSLRLEIPVLALAQLRREEPGSNKPPTMSDLRESGQIEADANNIILLHQVDPDKSEWSESGVQSYTPATVNFVLEKQRSGATGLVKTVFQKRWGTFHSYEGGRDSMFEEGGQF